MPVSLCPVAIVGVSALFPGSLDVGGFWRDILAGRDLITDVPPSHWLIDDYYDPDPSTPDRTYGKRGGFLPDVPFNPVEFGIPPSILPATDTAQLLALMVAKQVLEDAAQGDFANLNRERISVILGVTSAQELMLHMASRMQRPIIEKSLRDEGLPEDVVQAVCARVGEHYVPWQESTFPGLLGNVVAGRIANRFDLGGTNCVTDAACASSISAMSMALNELHLGQSDMVICGGVDTMNDVSMYMCFSKTPALSPTGDCRPFAADSDGTMLGEGLGMVALKRLADAERDGDRIYAVVRGLGSGSDGRALSVYAPRAEGQMLALDRAYLSAGYGPETVELVEAHGTGTKAGDVAEFEALAAVFNRSGRADRQWCALGSVKSQIGHTKATAGAAGLIKAVLALHHKVLPPTIKVAQPNPKLDIEQTPFHLNTQARPWIRDAAHPRRAAVSSFGFGGSNFHTTLEEYTGPAPRAHRVRAVPGELVVLSAGDAKGVVDECHEWRQRLKDETPLAFVAHRTQMAFDAAKPARLAIVATDLADLRAKLDQAAESITREPAKALSMAAGLYFQVGAEAGDIAFLFPGQGSQYVSMGSDLAMTFDLVRSRWDRAAAAVNSDTPLHRVVFPVPAFTDDDRRAQSARLTSTEWAQPAIGVTSLAQLALLRALGVAPSIVGGHSYGEVTALHAAGVLSDTDMVRVAHRRGALMAAAAATTSGAMTAVGRPAPEVEALLADWGVPVVVANANSPRQTVLSGTTEAIADVETRLTAAGLTCTRLPVATAFHSPIVSPACEPFLDSLKDVPFEMPGLPVYANATAAPYAADAAGMRALLADQIVSPVRFADMIARMHADGVRTFVEVGPGTVLTGLVDQCLAGQPHEAIPLDRKGRHGVTSLWHGLGRLAVAGVAMRFVTLWDGFAVPEDAAAPAPFTVKINGSNYGKPYPKADGTPVPSAPRARTLPHPASPHVSQPSVPVSPASPAATIASPASAAAEAPPASPAVPTPWPSAPPGPPLVRAEAPGTARLVQDAHGAFQQAMMDTHLAFLSTMSASFQSYCAAVSGQSVTAVPADMPVPQPFMTPAPVPALPAPPAVAPVVAQAPPAFVPRSVAAPVPAAAMAPPPLAPPPVAVPAAAAAVDVGGFVLAVVADKTGYPVEMLNLDMALEADLGIDSIKRVEILAATQAQVPGLSELDPTEMASLRTLGEIVCHLESRRPAAAAAAPAVAAPSPASVTAAEPTPAPVDVGRFVLAIVADKTGYPAEMLNLEMALEADLGIDSIKRVEILAATQAQVPGLSALDPTAMAGLRTLGEIVNHLESQRPEASPAPPAAASSPATATFPQAAVPPAAPVPGGRDLGATLLAVVADKTGYPVDMLKLDMALEADLGVDSIKRVEILAAMRTAAPDLPEVDPSDMAAVRTLREIVDYLERPAGTPTDPAPTPPVDRHPRRSEVAEPEPERASRFVVREVAATASGRSMLDAIGSGLIAITDDGHGVAAALAQRLGAQGARVSVVETVPPEAAGVVLLDGLRTCTDVSTALGLNRRAFQAARAFAPRASKDGGLFVTVQDTGGDFGLAGVDGESVWTGGLAALAKTAAQEWPSARVKAIDLERGRRPAAKLAAAIVQELVAGGDEIEVGLRKDGRRTTLASVAEPVVPVRSVVNEQSVIVATGGARGVTAASLLALARRARPRIVLMGRTPIAEEPAACRGVEGDAALKKALLAEANARGEALRPADLGARVEGILRSREVRETLAALEAAGSPARYVAVDAREAGAVREALADVRSTWGPITGLVHGAGVLADKRLTDKTVEQFDLVFDTKVGGLRTLLEATADDPLTTICLFSSVAARAGNPGQSDYAMANEVLNKVAAREHRRRGGACLVTSINWGPWEGGMVTPALAAEFARRGVSVLPVATGARMFCEELEAAPSGNVEVVIGGLLSGDAHAFGPSRHTVAVDAKSYPYLTGHRIQSDAVVPAVLALEWFMRAASVERPDLAVIACDDLRVYRGIPLPDFDGQGHTLAVTLQTQATADGAVMTAALVGPDGTRHYGGTLTLGPAAKRVAPPTLSAGTLEACPWTSSHIYGELLFHGPEFQVIRSVEGVSDQGLVGVLEGVHAQRWGGGPYRTDVAALDGAVQLAQVWGLHRVGRLSLPTRIGAFRQWQTGPIDGPLTCVLEGRVTGTHGLAVNLLLVDSSGHPVASMADLEMHMLPASKSSQQAAGVR